MRHIISISSRLFSVAARQVRTVLCRRFACFLVLAAASFAAPAAWTQVEAVHPSEALRPRSPEFDEHFKLLSPDEQRILTHHFQLTIPQGLEDVETAEQSIRRMLRQDSRDDSSLRPVRLQPTPHGHARRELRGFHLTPPNPAPADKGSPEYIRWVQKSLNVANGASIPVDGELTETTRQAIREFQSRNGLVADGIVGPKTEATLESGTSVSLRGPRSLPNEAVTRQQLDGYFQTPTERLLTNQPLLVDRLFGTPAERRIKDDMAFLDVKNQNGDTWVAVSKGTDYLWVEDKVGSAKPHQTWHEVSTKAELEQLIGSSTTIVHRGDDLPKECQDWLRTKDSYLRSSDRSPKTDVGQYIRAREILDRPASRDLTRILSALPHETERRALIRQLDKMDLDRGEVDAWQSLQREMDQVQADSGYSIEVGTKEEFLRELRDDKHDYLVLVAHSADGLIRFPGGETLSLEELKGLSRAQAPQRTLVLISCSAGAVNGPRPSPSEIVITNNLAANVIAPPDSVSALVVPGMLREFLVGGKTVGKAFSRLGQVVSENKGLEMTPETGVSGELLFRP
jgi:hypothetical protein